MTFRIKLAAGFAVVALATATAVAIATPAIVGSGFTRFQTEVENEQAATGSPNEEDSTVPASAEAEGTQGPSQLATVSGQLQEQTSLIIILLALAAALVASLAGLALADRTTRPLTRLEEAAAAVSRGDLSRRSGLADRGDEFGQLGRTFDRMADELERSDDQRRRFLQDAAHELRTPLTVIDATASALLDGVYPPERRHLETIQAQSRLLARIVDDLRTISLAEGGNLVLRREPVDVSALLSSVATGFESRAAIADVHVEAPAGSAGRVLGDPDRLRQMLAALVDNAIRHTPAGGEVVLRAGRAGEFAAAGQDRPTASIRIVVDDTGPGIAEGDLPHLFERFYQADQARDRRTGTSGLGLAIVHALAQVHGGFAGAENRPGGGARFWIELPEAI